MLRHPAAGRSLWIWEACRGLAVLAGHCSLLRDRGACHDTIFYCGRGFKSLTSELLRSFGNLKTVICRRMLQREVLLLQILLRQPQRPWKYCILSWILSEMLFVEAVTGRQQVSWVKLIASLNAGCCTSWLPRSFWDRGGRTCLSFLWYMYYTIQ